MQVIYYKQDRRSILFMLLCMSLLLSPFMVDIPSNYSLIWLLISSLFCFNACIINHNHVHSAIFQKNIFNNIFGILLTLAKGHTSAGVILAHNYNHHVHNGGAQDWINPHLAGEGPGAVRIFRFVINSVITMARGRRSVTEAVLSTDARKQIRVEKISLLLFITIFIYIDAYIFILYVAMPWLVGVFLLISVNLLQHDKCKPDSKYNHSRNFTGKLGNWFFFNNGYHTAHHMKPELHWSKLPELHDKEISPVMDRSLEKSSIVLFLIKKYLIA